MGEVENVNLFIMFNVFKIINCRRENVLLYFNIFVFFWKFLIEENILGKFILIKMMIV